MHKSFSATQYRAFKYVLPLMVSISRLLFAYPFQNQASQKTKGNERHAHKNVQNYRQTHLLHSQSTENATLFCLSVFKAKTMHSHANTHTHTYTAEINSIQSQTNQI